MPDLGEGEEPINYRVGKTIVMLGNQMERYIHTFSTCHGIEWKSTNFRYVGLIFITEVNYLTFLMRESLICKMQVARRSVPVVSCTV